MFGINACDVDTITVMGNAVNDCICQRTVITAELSIPFLKFILGAENRRRFLASPVEQFEDIPLF